MARSMATILLLILTLFNVCSFAAPHNLTAAELAMDAADSTQNPTAILVWLIAAANNDWGYAVPVDSAYHKLHSMSRFNAGADYQNQTISTIVNANTSPCRVIVWQGQNGPAAEYHILERQVILIQPAKVLCLCCGNTCDQSFYEDAL